MIQRVDITVFVESNCKACERVLEMIELLRKEEMVSAVRVIHRESDSQFCENAGVFIYPATFINGQLAFYGEFTMEDAIRFGKVAENIIINLN